MQRPTPFVTPNIVAGAAVEDPSSQLTRLETSNRVLQHEVSRYEEDFRQIAELTATVACTHDPDRVQELILDQVARLLRTTSLYVDRAGCCRAVCPAGDPLPASIPSETVRATLAHWIESTRRSETAGIVTLSPHERDAVGGASVLLAAIPREDEQTGVVAALRGPDRPPFDGRDLIVLRALLAYGVQSLGHAVTARHLQRTKLQTISALVNAIDAKDDYTSCHSERVGALARLLGVALGRPPASLEALEWAGLLHDIGKIGISEQILNKPGILTPAEMEEMRRHPRIGYDMLKPLTDFEPLLEAILHHHENHDGSGYPHGLADEQISIESRIIHVVDIFDALTSSRPYRKAHSVTQALRILEQDAGRVTDPMVTKLFLELAPQYLIESAPGACRPYPYDPASTAGPPS